jgi:integrase
MKKPGAHVGAPGPHETVRRGNSVPRDGRELKKPRGRRAKQFFRAVLRNRIIPENLFADAKPPSQVNEARKFFVTLEAASKVLDACPDTEWRLLFALSRFGGLRCPSEHFALTWADVDWERERFLVRSSKTEHHEGKAERWVPVFPELRPYLEAAFDQAEDGAVYVFPRRRDTSANLRTRLMKIIRRAALAEAVPQPACEP